MTTKTEHGRVGRRALLAGGVVAGAGAAASLLGATPALATDGQPVIAGRENDNSSSTLVSATEGSGLIGQTTQEGFAGLEGDDFAPEGGSYGVVGYSQNGTGVYGESDSVAAMTAQAFGSGYAGVYAGSDAGDGVWGGTSDDSYAGVYGTDQSGGDGIGVWGVSADGVGVYGSSTTGTGVQGVTPAAGYTAIYGDAPAGVGVWGSSETGGYPGVLGANESKGGIGVEGESNYGTGVLGTSFTGTGVLAASGSNGTALYVDGPATFSTCGVVTTSGTVSKVTVTKVAVTRSSLVIATCQTAVAGVSVEGVELDVAARSFTIYLTKAVAKGHKIAWFMLQEAPGSGPDQPLARPARHRPAAVVAPVRHRPSTPRLKPTRARVAKASARR
jgi:hypothetical protein